MMMKRKCELCSNLAKIFCESDQANLCYECDSKIHGANFLVAKHSRTLLCHVCQSPTLWTGSGPKFGPTLSVCPACLTSNRAIARHRDVKNGDNHEDEDRDDDKDDGGGSSNEDDDDDDDDGDNGSEEDESDNGDDDEHEDDEENQVVPWSYSVSHTG